MLVFLSCFFFSSRRRHTRYWRDWSSDVCSSDLDGTAQLELVTRPQLVGEVRRHLTVLGPLDQQVQPGVLGGGGHRVAALGRAAVLGGQPQVDVLAGQVTRPAGDVEEEPVDAGGDRKSTCLNSSHANISY